MSLNKGKDADVSKYRKAFFFQGQTLLGLLDPEVEGTRSLKPGEMFV